LLGALDPIGAVPNFVDALKNNLVAREDNVHRGHQFRVPNVGDESKKKSSTRRHNNTHPHRGNPLA